MPAVYERNFRARFNECDAYGHVNHAIYLTYMQEAAFDASAAVGYDFPAHAAIERLWFIRESQITFLKPLQYNDPFIVKTWVADVRRVRSLRMYEFRFAESNDLLAAASTDWVFLDSKELRPATIPPEMALAYIPEGSPPRVKRDPFPTPPPPPAELFKCTRRVNWRDVDPAGHVNNTVYLHYLEDCATELVRVLGWPVTRMSAEGFGIIAREYRIEYLEPAHMDEELEIATWVSDVKRATAVRHYTINRAADGRLLARARALWVWVDLQNGRPMRIPTQFLADCAGNITSSRTANDSL